MSPTGKSKITNKAPKKKGTGVAAAHLDYPASTNISSPIQAASRRRLKHDKCSPTPELHRNGYARDDFVVDDEEHDYHNESEDESDAFESPRMSRSSRKRTLGPPIRKVQTLQPIHEMIVDNFVENAKEECRKASIVVHCR